MDKKTNEVKEIKFCPTCCTIRSGTVGGILFSAIGGALSYITSKVVNFIIFRSSFYLPYI